LAERKSIYALITLGWIYDTGSAGKADRNLARIYYERAATEGSCTAYHYLGWLFWENGDEKKSRDAFENGVLLGNDDCKAAIEKLDVSNAEQAAATAIRSKNYDVAVRLLLPLADKQSEYALLSLGWIFEMGASGAIDMDKAQLYYQRAAAQGADSAYFKLGHVYLSQSEEKLARSAFEAGAELGDIASMSKLGRMMLEGRGGEVNLEGGSLWLKKAASQGHIFAERFLLGYELHEAKSIYKKLSAKMKIASLAKRGAIEMLKNPRSDKLR
jgi:uncharacterized protein